jgi:predicted HTH transcriptional regulator
METFDVADDTAGRDLKGLVDLGVLARTGSGRSTKYVVPESNDAS